MPEDFPDSAEVVDGHAILAAIGLADLAEQPAEAHGGNFTYAQAIERCKPFAEMITSMATNLEGVPNRQEILTKTVLSIQAPKGESPDFLVLGT